MSWHDDNLPSFESPRGAQTQHAAESLRDGVNPFAARIVAHQAACASASSPAPHGSSAMSSNGFATPGNAPTVASVEVVHVHKIASALRDLDAVEEALEFHLITCLKKPHDEPAPTPVAPVTPGTPSAPAAATASGASDAHFSPATRVYVATCPNAPVPELSRCVVKLTASRELARNEWDHLTNYRSPIFPTPFLLGRTDADERVIVMEYIEGSTLQSLINAGFGEDRGPAPVEKALEILSPLAASFKMLSLDERRFVHRDIKPDNIVVTTGTCKTRLLDLGISAHDRDRLQHRHAGATPGFAPPEIEHPESYPANEPISLCSPRIDAYALSATLYALITGHPPRTYGATLHASELRHDESIVNAVREQARASIQAKHGRTVDAKLLDALVAQALRTLDNHLADLVTRGLSYLQRKRPTPAEFFDELPTAYVHSLVDAVHVLYLESLASEAVHPARIRTVSPLPGEDAVLADTPLADGYRYDGFADDFCRAMDCWNRGDYNHAVPLLKKLDAAGDLTSQYNLGICYRDGLGGLTSDRARMLACWTKAAEAGHVVAAFNVARCHERGDGIPATPEAARTWYHRSAEGGYPDAVAWVRENG